jgi:NAD(P)-dependent dehydrogenase (short-subunit alcohol dehydrogenase family)
MTFEGMVAVITGAGGVPGMGRSHAHLLAKLGAKVVVNDLGLGSDGSGRIPTKADVVVDEIRQFGGEAVADANSVATEAGARAIIDFALETFGKVDILINNAGAYEFALFEQLTSAHIEKILSTHLMGTIWMCKAVWPFMQKAKYGRIVNTVSASFLGARYASVYGAAKGGVMGLTRNLAIEGADYGIRVNALSPGAATVAWRTMSAPEVSPSPELLSAGSPLSPDLVAPTAAFLAHRDCPVTGLNIGSEGGKVFETFYMRTKGAKRTSWTPDDIRDSWGKITSQENAEAVGAPFDGGAGFTLTPRKYDPDA